MRSKLGSVSNLFLIAARLLLLHVSLRLELRFGNRTSALLFGGFQARSGLSLGSLENGARLLLQGGWGVEANRGTNFWNNMSKIDRMR